MANCGKIWLPREKSQRICGRERWAGLSMRLGMSKKLKARLAPVRRKAVEMLRSCAPVSAVLAVDMVAMFYWAFREVASKTVEESRMAYRGKYGSRNRINSDVRKELPMVQLLSFVGHRNIHHPGLEHAAT